MVLEQLHKSFQVTAIRRAVAILLCCAGFFVPHAVQAQGVVKLFSTPAERAELERRRLLLARPESVTQEVVQPIELVELPTLIEEQTDIVISLGGSMLRSDGSYTIWINDVPVNQEDLPGHMELLTPFSQGKLRVRNAATGNSYDVKPGQVLNLTSGQILESYELAQMESAEPEAVTESETIEPDLDATAISDSPVEIDAEAVIDSAEDVSEILPQVLDQVQ